MTRPVYSPSIDELNNFVGTTLVTAVALIAFKDTLNINKALFYVAVAVIVLFSRELGQRLVAHWMEAEIELNFSIEGSLTTLFGALMSFLTSLPIILLFPIFNSFSVESYEHWGKSIDAMWIKRKYWIVSGGIISMLTFYSVFQYLGMPQISEAISLFLIFQLLPFNYSNIPTGPLDGSIIIRWSGFMWLIFMGSAILTLLAA
ncbi:MAG: hypothetical protein BRC29_04795 [Nanohaloarchaea archaeon SW_7_43_1]|nr:MAG: hypothetical protein BRC29_04795 [Nanohaloarchaea archaeon SW_7_43_1]